MVPRLQRYRPHRLLQPMLSPDDIQQLCERKYPAFLRSVVTGEQFFPMPIRFGRPSTADDWEKLRREISALANGQVGYRIEWTETNTRRWGRQKLPDRVWFESETEFLRAVRKASEVEKFRSNLALARTDCAALEGWLAGNTSRLVEFSAVWPDLLKVCRYFLAHPRPGLYARELPIDVDTKFIERYQSVLRNLLDFFLPEEARTKAERFEERFGLRFDEPSVRFRILDPALKQKLSLPLDDLATPLLQFRRLAWESLKIVIVENKMTFLTLPVLHDTIGIWGGGGAAELLTSVEWLGRCGLFYWGDMDVHGFHILSRPRANSPDTQSLLMGLQTVEGFRRFAVAAKPAPYDDVANLNESELCAYAAVRDAHLLIEQEKIAQAHVETCLRSALS